MALLVSVGLMSITFMTIPVALNGGQNSLLGWLNAYQEKKRRQQMLAKICGDAMQRSGVFHENFTLTDIGILAYRTQNNPKIVRSTPVLTDTRYLRPFAEISAHRSDRVTVRLEIHDSQRRVVYANDGQYHVRRKAQILPQTWLPLENVHAHIGQWLIEVYIEGEPFAVHPFGWEVLADNDILNQLRTDGEINDDLRQAVKSGKFRKMSLDELLSDQEE